MKKIPHYRQLDIMDCGMTCRQMVAEYYENHFNFIENKNDL